MFSVGIDADDLFYIENNVADFLVKSQGDLYGTLPTGLVGGIKPFRHTATTA